MECHTITKVKKKSIKISSSNIVKPVEKLGSSSRIHIVLSSEIQWNTI
jgi:hypothetical protein